MSDTQKVAISYHKSLSNIKAPQIKRTLSPCTKRTKPSALFAFIDLFTANKFYISETADRKKKEKKPTTFGGETQSSSISTCQEHQMLGHLVTS